MRLLPRETAGYIRIPWGLPTWKYRNLDPNPACWIGLRTPGGPPAAVCLTRDPSDLTGGIDMGPPCWDWLWSLNLGNCWVLLSAVSHLLLLGQRTRWELANRHKDGCHPWSHPSMPALGLPESKQGGVCSSWHRTWLVGWTEALLTQPWLWPWSWLRGPQPTFAPHTHTHTHSGFPLSLGAVGSLTS